FYCLFSVVGAVDQNYQHLMSMYSNATSEQQQETIGQLNELKVKLKLTLSHIARLGLFNAYASRKRGYISAIEELIESGQLPSNQEAFMLFGDEMGKMSSVIYALSENDEQEVLKRVMQINRSTYDRPGEQDEEVENTFESATGETAIPPGISDVDIVVDDLRDDLLVQDGQEITNVSPQHQKQSRIRDHHYDVDAVPEDGDTGEEKPDLQKEPCSLSDVEGQSFLSDEEFRENKADATTGEEYETNNTVQVQGVESDGARGFSFSSRRSSSSSSDDGNVECPACTEVEDRSDVVCGISISALNEIQREPHNDGDAASVDGNTGVDRFDLKVDSGGKCDVEIESNLNDDKHDEENTITETSEEHELDAKGQLFDVEHTGCYSFRSRLSSSSSSDEECLACIDDSSRDVCNISVSDLQEIHNLEGVYRYGMKCNDLRYTIFVERGAATSVKTNIERNFPKHNFIFEPSDAKRGHIELAGIHKVGSASSGTLGGLIDV
ncbi:unnamed protein product, partial [Owenia fusiformis]